MSTLPSDIPHQPSTRNEAETVEGQSSQRNTHQTEQGSSEQKQQQQHVHEQAAATAIFSEQFDYRDYLFDTNSDSPELQSGPNSEATAGHQLTQASLQTAVNTSISGHPQQQHQHQQIVDFGLDHHQQQQQFVSQQSAAAVAGDSEFLPSGGTIVGSSNSLPSNEFMLFATSMLDTSTDLSAMQETASGTAATATSKVVDYFTSPPPLQSSLPQDSPAMGSMSQQLSSLESDHAQTQQPQATQLQHESDNFVQHFHHRINGNGVSAVVPGHNSDSQVAPLPNDTNNNPVGEVSEDLKENITMNMLGEGAAMATSMSDPASTPSSINSQYMNSNVMLDTNNSSSGAVMNSNGSSHVLMSQELVSHPQQMQSQQTQSLDSQIVSPAVSNEQQQQQQQQQASMLNMMSDTYSIGYSNDSQMQQHEQNFVGAESSLGSQQSGQEVSSPGLYHSHHHPSLQQMQQTSSQQQSQQQQSQQASAQHLNLQQQQQSSSMSAVVGSSQANVSNQQMNHHGQSMSHHHLPQHHHSAMVANAPSTPGMEYGQPQLLPSPAPSIESNNNQSNSVHQQQQSANQNPASQNVASMDTMMSQKSSVSQPSSVSSSAESEAANYANASADYLLHSAAHATSAHFHHTLHQQHPEGQQQQQMCPSSSSSTSTSLSSSTAPPHSLPNTAHQRTHYMPSSENLLSSSSNVVTQSAGTNVNNNSNANAGLNAPTSETGVSSASGSTSASSQMLGQFESMDSAGSVPSSTLSQQSRYVLIKCDSSAPPHTYQEVPKTHPSVQQMQFDPTNVPQAQSQAMQSHLSISESNTSTSGPITIQVQHVAPTPQQQPHLLNSVGGQQGGPVDEALAGHAGATFSGASLTPNSGNSQLCISLANQAVVSGGVSLQSSQVPTVTLAGMPSNSNGLRPVCVITDPNVATLPPLHAPTQQAQVNFPNLPPKKIRFANASPGNTSVPNQSPAPALLFASKSSVTPSVVQSQLSQQQHQHAGNQAPNVVQAMIVPSNLAFSQAQPIQQSQIQTNVATSNIIAASPAVNLQTVAAKPFVPISGNTEQNYSSADLIMQRQYTPSSVPPSSTNTSATYQSSSEGNSSNQSGSQQFNQRVSANISTSVAPVNVSSTQAQIFFSANPGASVPQGANIRILDNYSILSLQPASIQQQQQAQQNQAQAGKPNSIMPHKILFPVHSVPVTSDGSHPSVNPAATALISLNPDFSLSSGPAGQVALAGHLPAMNNGPNGGNAIASGKMSSSLTPGSIILSPIIHNPNIPGSQSATRAVTNFAVPIPVVTSAIGEQRPHNVTIHVANPVSGQFPAPSFVPNVSQPTIVSTVPAATHAPALATKSTKMPSSQANKAASKAGNSTSSKGASGSSASGSSSGSTSKSMNPPPLMSDDPAKPFKCCLCGKNLASKNVYQLHLRSHSGEKPFSCHLCNNRFSQKTSLTRHMRSHTGERPFPCQVCNKRFADKERIKIHMRIHTGEKPFSCVVCGKKFSQKSTVKRHMSVHTGVKPFKCDVCGKGFANRGNLTAHTKTHQPQAHHQSRSMASSSNNNNNNSNNTNASSTHQQSQQNQPIGMQSAGPATHLAGANIVYASSASASSNTSANNGPRQQLEIGSIKIESEDMSEEGKSAGVGLVVHPNSQHNHQQQQFTSASMPQQASKPLSS